MNFELKKFVNKLKEKEILLPDFQRGFVWKDVEKQSRLAASVLTRLPLGTLLLLESSNPQEYKCRVIGTNNSVEDDELDNLKEVKFLLDGQQRITVLANLFTNTIFEISKGITKLADSSLRNRYFLAIPKYGKGLEDEDIFGAQTLKFPFDPDKIDVDFSSSQVLSYIRNKYIKGKISKEPFNYYNAEAKENLESYCISTEDSEFLIPLFLLEGEAQATRKGKKIVKSIANKNVELIVDKCCECLNGENSNNNVIFVLSPIITDKDTLNNIKAVINKGDINKSINYIREVLDNLGDDWAENMENYLNSCIKNINIDEIVIKESNRARGIDIYENLNMGGVELSVFDLLVARAAKSSNESLTVRLENSIDKERQYNYSQYINNHAVMNAFKKNYLGENSEPYRASYLMECKRKNSFSKTYIEAFINVLSLIVYGKGFEKQEFNIDYIKRKKVLELTSEQINDNCEIVCDAIDRALFFLQARCGVRKLAELNYSLMLTVIAYTLSFEECYNSDNFLQVLNLLEAWYWSSIFSGKYDKDQNITMIKDIKNILDNVVDIVNKEKNINVDWLNERKSMILDCPSFSDKEFIINGDPISESSPKVVLNNAVCQYYLSKTYYDLKFKDNLLLDSTTDDLLSVFHLEVKNFEIHHVIPLGAQTIKDSTKKKRNDKLYFLNYPMNLMYITSRANKDISAKSLEEYQALIPTYADLRNLGFTKLSINSACSENDKKLALEERFDFFKGELSKQVQSLLIF